MDVIVRSNSNPVNDINEVNEVNLGKAKVMVSLGVPKNGMSKSKVDPCSVCSLRVKTNLVLWLQCGKWIHSRCAGKKRVYPKFSRNFTSRKCEGNIGEAVELEVMLCDDMETVEEYTHLVDRVSAVGGCEAAVTVRARCGWVKFRECGELMYGMRFPIRLKRAVYRSYVRPALLHGSEAWCLKESEMVILRWTDRSMVRAMCGVQLKGRIRCTDLIFMLCLHETIDHLAVANSVCWYGCVLIREDGHVLRRALCFEVKGQRKIGRLKRPWKKQVEEKSEKIGLRKERAPCRSMWSVGVNKVAAGLK